MNDINGNLIKLGDRVRHTKSGEHYRIAKPGTDGLLNFSKGLIMVLDSELLGAAFELTEARAGKLEIVT